MIKVILIIKGKIMYDLLMTVSSLYIAIVFLILGIALKWKKIQDITIY